MDHNKLINRLELLEASAATILKEAARIKKALQPVSTGGKQNNGGLSAEAKARLLATREKNQARSNMRLSAGR